MRRVFFTERGDKWLALPPHVTPNPRSAADAQVYCGYLATRGRRLETAMNAFRSWETLTSTRQLRNVSRPRYIFFFVTVLASSSACCTRLSPRNPLVLEAYYVDAAVRVLSLIRFGGLVIPFCVFFVSRWRVGPFLVGSLCIIAFLFCFPPTLDIDFLVEYMNTSTSNFIV